MVCTRLLELAATRGVRVCSWIEVIVQVVMVAFFFFRKEEVACPTQPTGPVKTVDIAYQRMLQHISCTT